MLSKLKRTPKAMTKAKFDCAVYKLAYFLHNLVDIAGESLAENQCDVIDDCKEFVSLCVWGPYQLQAMGRGCDMAAGKGRGVLLLQRSGRERRGERQFLLCQGVLFTIMHQYRYFDRNPRRALPTYRDMVVSVTHGDFVCCMLCCSVLCIAGCCCTAQSVGFHNSFSTYIRLWLCR